MSGFSLHTLPARPFIDDMTELYNFSKIGGSSSSVAENGLLDLRQWRSLLIDARYSDTSGVIGDLATMAQLELLWGDASPQVGHHQSYSAVDVLNVRNTYGVPLSPGVWVGQMMRVPVRRENASALWLTNGADPETSLVIYGSGAPCDAPEFWPGPDMPAPFSLVTQDLISGGVLGPFTTAGAAQDGGVRTLSASVVETAGTGTSTFTPSVTVGVWTIATINGVATKTLIAQETITAPAAVTPAVGVPVMLGSAQVSMPPGPFWVTTTWAMATSFSRTWTGTVTLT